MINKFTFGSPASIQYNGNFSANTKAGETILTSSDALKETQDYKKVKDILKRLIQSGISRMGEGYCISVSDIVFNILHQNGIKCHLEEVQLSMIDRIHDKTHMVGFTTAFQQNSHTRVSTHVVVITDTEIPMLIDMSIAHLLPDVMQCIVCKVENKGSKVLCEVEKGGYSYTYQEKRDGIGVPQLHQISILDRISTDKKIFDEVKNLKRLNVIGIILSVFAVINVIAKIILDNY